MKISSLPKTESQPLLNPIPYSDEINFGCCKMKKFYFSLAIMLGAGSAVTSIYTMGGEDEKVKITGTVTCGSLILIAMIYSVYDCCMGRKANRNMEST